SVSPCFIAAFGVKKKKVIENDGKIGYGAITDEYKEYLKYMNKLYEKDLLDPETFSQSDEEKKAKGQNNRVGVFSDYFSYFTTGEEVDEDRTNIIYKSLKSQKVE